MFENLLKRANIASIEEFIKTGMDLTKPPSYKTYKARLADTALNVEQFLMSQFENNEEFEKAFDTLYDYIGEYQDIYFEIGMIAGMKIAQQIMERTKEIQ